MTLRGREDERRVRGQGVRAVLLAGVDTVVVITGAMWLYVATIAVLHPENLPIVVSSWLPIRRDTLGVVCFLISVSTFFCREIRNVVDRGGDA